MSEADTQAVDTTTNAQPQAVAEVAVAQDDAGDLDTLLKVYDEKVTAPAATATTPEPKPGTDPDLKTLADRLKRVDSLVTEANNLQFKRDMTDTVKTIRGDLDPTVFDDDLVEAFLNGKAKQDDRLAQAWLDRHAKPKQFEQVKTALAKDFAKKFSKMPDKAVTEDRELVSAAVRGASTRAPEGRPPEFGKMSNSDFQKEKDKLFGT
jgi:hypothetical protein